MPGALQFMLFKMYQHATLPMVQRLVLPASAHPVLACGKLRTCGDHLVLLHITVAATATAAAAAAAACNANACSASSLSDPRGAGTSGPYRIHRSVSVATFEAGFKWLGISET